MEHGGASRRRGWVHVSDVHFDLSEGADDAVRQEIARALCTDLRRLKERYEIDLVLATGDIAARGGGAGGAEFERGSGFIERLREIVGADEAGVLYVPGNHDVDRMCEKMQVRLLIEALQRDHNPDDALADEGSRGALAERMLPAKEFWARYGPGDAERAEHGWWRAHLPASQQSLAVEFVGLNTALTSYRQHEKGCLPIGRRQMEFLPEELPSHPVVVLGHHPFEWIAQGKAVFGRIGRVADVYACGHIHDASGLLMERTSGQRLFVLQAGAVHSSDDADEPPEYSYSVGVLEQRSDGWLGLTYVPRRWSEDNGDFRADVDRLPPHAAECDTFVLREPASTSTGSAPAAPVETTPGTGALTPAQAHVLCARYVGGRRIIYPSGDTVDDLLDSSLFVEPRLVMASREGPDQPADAGTLHELLAGEQSVLLLGEAGTGKSMAAWAAVRRMGDRAPYALVLDLPRFCEAASEASSLSDPLRYLVGVPPGIRIDGAQRENVRLVLDGVDEVLAGGFDPKAVAKGLEAACQRYPSLVVSRVEEFDRLLATTVPVDLFGKRRQVQPWSFEGQFRELVGSLSVAGMIDGDPLAEAVSTRPDLVTRPLYAQMVTYVGSDEASAIENPTQLFGAFVRKLASTVDPPPRGHPAPAKLWELAATEVYFEDLLKGSSVATEQVLSRSADAGDPDEARRILGAIFDFGSAGSPDAQLLHHSLYEFLVAAAVADALHVAVETHGPWGSFGRRELSREIRHHLVALLNGQAAEPLSDWMTSQFDELRAVRPRTHIERYQLNLLIYLAGRLAEAPLTLLSAVVDDTDEEPFLINGAAWSLAARGDWAHAARYVFRLEAKPQLAAVNRGYHCWYYGDVPVDEEAPVDGRYSPLPWRNARQRIIEKIRDDLRPERLPARTLLDVFTFLDFARTRASGLTPDESAVIGEAMGSLRVQEPERTVNVLRKMLGDILKNTSA